MKTILLYKSMLLQIKVHRRMKYNLNRSVDRINFPEISDTGRIAWMAEYIFKKIYKSFLFSYINFVSDPNLFLFVYAFYHKFSTSRV